MMVDDFWLLTELGAEERAADVFYVLRLFLSAYPERNAPIEPCDDSLPANLLAHHLPSNIPESARDGG